MGWWPIGERTRLSFTSLADLDEAHVVLLGLTGREDEFGTLCKILPTEDDS